MKEVKECRSAEGGTCSRTGMYRDVQENAGGQEVQEHRDEGRSKGAGGLDVQEYSGRRCRNCRRTEREGVQK